MRAQITFLIAFACIFGGTLLGMFLRNWLPDHHLSNESKDVVKLGIGTLATLAALVLGLLIASAKGTFDTMSNGLRQTSSRVILLDRDLANYGPETAEARNLLRRAVAGALARMWPEERIGPELTKEPHEKVNIEIVQDKIRQLTPRNDAQRQLQSRAIQVSGDIAEGRWFLLEQMGQTSLPRPFFTILIFWLTVIFGTFGLFSPRNATVITVLFICALSIAGSLFLIIELDSPYTGWIKVSSVPLRHALANLGAAASGMPQ